MKTLLSFILMCCFVGAAIATSVLEWYRLLPSLGEASSVVCLSDGGFVVVGNGVIMRLTSRGDTLWSQSFSSPSGGWAVNHKVIFDSDSNLVVAGEWYNAGIRAFIRKLSLSSDLIWCHEYILTEYTGFNDIKNTPGGGFVAVGKYLYINGFIARLDEQGDTLWTRIIPNEFIPSGVIVSPDSAYLISGYTSNPDYPIFARYSLEGNQDWIRYCGGMGRSATILLENSQLLIGFGTASYSDYSGQPRWSSMSTDNGLACTAGVVPSPTSHISDAMPISNGYLLAGWTGYSTYDHLGYILKVDSFDPSRVVWTTTIHTGTSYNREWSQFNGIASTLDGGFVAVGRGTGGTHQDWLIAKYCPEDAPAGGFTIIHPGPPDWGFSLGWLGGELDTIAFTNISDGAYGDVTGSAAADWHILNNGDGNDGDSIIFVASQPFGGWEVDTFWIRNMQDNHCTISYIAECPKGIIGLDNGGHVEILAEGLYHSGFAVVRDTAAVRKIIFSQFPTGTTGRITGVASLTWEMMSNGDGNNGDSVIFFTGVPLLTGSVDTFWLDRPEGSGIADWSIGCNSGTARVFTGIVDSVRFAGQYLANGISLSLTTYNESYLSCFRVFGKHTTSAPWVEIGVIPATNDSGPNHYLLNGGVRGIGFQFMVIAEDSFGVQREYDDQVLIVGQNVPTDMKNIYLSTEFKLSSFPNPFNPSTTISFSLPKSAITRLTVYDLLGREVAVLTDHLLEAGEHNLQFDGSDLPSGLYFARLQSGDFVTTQKLLLVK